MRCRAQPDVEPVLRDGDGRMVTWTGAGFARVRDGAGLTFHVDNVPYPMEYELLLRYEPEVRAAAGWHQCAACGTAGADGSRIPLQSAEDWEAVVSVSSRALPTSPRCGNLLPSEQMYREGLPHSQRWDGVGGGLRKDGDGDGERVGWDEIGNGIGVERRWRWRWGWGGMGRGRRLGIWMGMGLG